MRTITRFFCVCFPLFITTLSFNSATAQTKSAAAQKLSPGEQLERKFAWWSLTMEQVRVQVGATQQGYNVFNRFYKQTIDSVHLEFLHRVNNSSLGVNDIKQY